jgi:predicted DNA-binding transcriptional regulator AlpA
MEGLMGLLRVELLKIVENIDAGNSNMSEEDMTQTIMALRQYSHKDEWMTKYQACQFLGGISRATFDNLVSEGKIPKGKKNFAGDSSLFWKATDLMEYRKKRSAKSS